MTIRNKLFLLLVALATCMGCDQATKRLAELTLKNARPRSFFGNLIRLEYAENPGAFLGMGATLPELQRWILLSAVASAILIGLTAFICLRRDLHARDIFGYALILAGGISNMFDRLAAGVVVDFMNLGIGNLRTGIFNVADVAIMSGLFVIVWSHWLAKTLRQDTIQPTNINA